MDGTRRGRAAVELVGAGRAVVDYAEGTLVIACPP
jgi:hypothetical protein